MSKRINIKTICMIVILLYAGGIFANQRINSYKISQEINKQHTELQKLMEKNQRLQDEVNMSKTDLFIEKQARERLGLIKEGETPVIHSSDSK